MGRFGPSEDIFGESDSRRFCNANRRQDLRRKDFEERKGSGLREGERERSATHAACSARVYDQQRLKKKRKKIRHRHSSAWDGRPDKQFWYLDGCHQYLNSLTRNKREGGLAIAKPGVVDNQCWRTSMIILRACFLVFSHLTARWELRFASLIDPT